MRSYWENNIYTITLIDPDIPVLTIQDKRGKTKRIHRNNVTSCNEFVLWEQEQQQNQSCNKSTNNQADQISPHNHVNTKAKKLAERQETKGGRTKQILEHPQKVEFTPSPEIINSVVDYPLSSESEDEETLVFVPFRGGGYGDVPTPVGEDVVACEEAEDTLSVPEAEELGVVESLSEDEISGVLEENQGLAVTEPGEQRELSEEGWEFVESESESEVEVVESSESVSEMEESSEHESVVGDRVQEDVFETDIPSASDYSSSDSESPVRRQSQRERRAPDRYSP